MGDAELTARLRERLITILCSHVCQTIHFKVDNVHIQWGMYGYIGNAIRNGFLDVVIKGSGSADGSFVGYLEGYGVSRTFEFTSDEVPADTIVHEGTHAIIFSTNPGLKVTNGTHETAGWLAATIYRLKTGYPNLTPAPRVDKVLEQVANRFIAEESKKNAIFTVTPGEASDIKNILERTFPNYRNGVLDNVETQIELPSRRGGLLRIMRQEQMEIEKARSQLPAHARLGLGLSESAIKKVLGKK